MTVNKNKMNERPVRPHPYFEKSQRKINNTPRSQSGWERICRMSEQYDLDFEKWQGNARAELQNLPTFKPLEHINISVLIDSIISQFEAREGCVFESSGMEYLKTLIYYCFDSGVFGYLTDQFAIQNNVIKSIHGVDLEVRKSKGLFIAGNFGTGKSKIADVVNNFIFNSMKNEIQDHKGDKRLLRDYIGSYSGFKMLTSTIIKQSHEAKNGLYEMVLEYKHLMIDDLFTEDKSFGREVLSEVLEERYSRGLKTSIICNFQGNSIEDTLTAYGERYGSRLFDRAFESFNFIEVKGVSKRK